MKTFLFLLVQIIATISTLSYHNEFFKSIRNNKNKIVHHPFDIVKILVPKNNVNYDFFHTPRKSESFNANYENLIYFIVKANIKLDGRYNYQGLFVIRGNNEKMLLENGTDMAATTDDSNDVFLAARDGIYVYNGNTDNLQKYGKIKDSIVNIEKEQTGDVLYILTTRKEVYKVSHKGTRREIIEDIVNAEQIILDHSNNIFFCETGKQVFVRTKNSVVQFTDLPETISNVLMYRSVYDPLEDEQGIMCLADYKLYKLYPNGTSIPTGLKTTPETTPTAISMEIPEFYYFAVDKKIYVLDKKVEKKREWRNPQNRPQKKELI